MVSHHLFIGGDYRLASLQRAPNPVGCRVEAADRFDHDVDVALQDLIETRCPDDARVAELEALAVGAAIDDVRELEGP